MGIPVGSLIAIFETMYKERWKYTWGSAVKGNVDCSGAFVYAYKQFGQSISHGSNTIGRKHITGNLLPVSMAKPGYAAFKLRNDGKEPDKYKGDGIGNLYHIGLVGNDGYVLNAKGTSYGFSKDKLSLWAFVAPLKAVDYEEGGIDMSEVLFKAKVTTASGSLNMRKAAAKTAAVVGRLPQGTVVEVTQEVDGWLAVRSGTMEGWCDASFLTKVDADASTSTTASVVITDSAGNSFRPVGKFTVEVT